jgi:hypothetical protein
MTTEEEPAAVEDDGEQKRSSGQRERVLAVGREAELWRDADRNAYASVRVKKHIEHYKLKSRDFRNWLLARYVNRFSKVVDGKPRYSVPSTQAVLEAMNALEAIAAQGPEFEPAVRVAMHCDRVIVDLGTDDWSAIAIDNSSWYHASGMPLRFIRPGGMRPLPIPVRGGSVDELRRFLNVNNEAFMLIVGWLVGALFPVGPYPILVINGEQGAGKSVLVRMLRRLIDPNRAEIRSAPHNERDLIIAAQNGRVVALDNLSFISSNLSDAMCRVATGAGFSTRQLYSDAEETIIAVARPQIVNGIPDLASRSDLADRAITVTLPRLDGSHRKPENDLWSQFELVAPRVLGALFDAISCALRLKDNVKLPRLPRMADFAILVEAAAPMFHWPAGAFLAAYEANRAEAIESTVEADPVAMAVLSFARAVAEGRVDSDRVKWIGTATQLLDILRYRVGEALSRSRLWPKDAKGLSSRLRRAAPGLRESGFEIELDLREGRNRARLIRIRESLQATVRSAPASDDGTNPLKPGENCADADAHDTDDAAASTNASVRTNPPNHNHKTAADAADDGRPASFVHDFDLAAILSQETRQTFNIETGEWIEAPVS